MMMQRLLKSTTTMLSKSKVNANQNRSITWKNATFDEKRKTNTVQVKWTGNGINFEGTDDQGRKALMSGVGEGPGVGPMQMVLIALAGCTSSDVVSILKKQRQDLQKLDIRVTGQRGAEYPKPWETAEITFEAAGDVDFQKLVHAVQTSADKYCGVEGTLKKQVNIVTIVRKLDKNGNVIATTEEGHSNYEKPKDS